MASLAVSHVVPGGTAPGTAVGYRLLTESGVSGSTAGFGLATQGVGSAVVLNGIFWLALVISIPLRGFHLLYAHRGGRRGAAHRRLCRHGPAHHPGPDPGHGAGSRRWPAACPWSTPRPSRACSRSWPIGSTSCWRTARCCATRSCGPPLNWLLDAASLWVFLLAFGQGRLPDRPAGRVRAGQHLGRHPDHPLGAGRRRRRADPDAGRLHVPKTTAILGVISYRLINFWLPIPVGGASYLSLRWRGHPRGDSPRPARPGSHSSRRRAHPRERGSGSYGVARRTRWRHGQPHRGRALRTLTTER